MIFKIKDKTGRIIHLTKERWNHITQQHPEITINQEEIQNILIKPLVIKKAEFDDTINYYYKYYKHRKEPEKYLLVIVKYLNNHGYIITAYYVKNLK